MTLEQFRVDRDFTYNNLARFLALPETTVFRICKQECKISLENAYLIMNLTEGDVSYVDLLESIDGGCQ